MLFCRNPIYWALESINSKLYLIKNTKNFRCNKKNFIFETLNHFKVIKVKRTMKKNLFSLAILIGSITACFSQTGTSQATAINLGTFTGTPISTSGSNVSGFTNCFTGKMNQKSPDVFFRFTVTNGIGVDINTLKTTSQFDTYIHLAQEVSSTQYVVIDDNDDLPGGNASGITRYLDPGTYLIIVEGYSNYTGTFNLDIALKSGVDISPIYNFIYGDKIINGASVGPDTVTFSNPKYIVYRISNNGFTALSGDIEYQIYMSDDNILNSATDVLFTSGTKSVTDFKPGSNIYISYNFSSRFTRNQIMNKFFFIVVDPSNKIAEINETNNTKEMSTVPGYYYNNAIQLGKLEKGQTYKTTVNNSPGLGFYNQGNQESADVFVEFTLAEDANVSFSLCNSKISDSYFTLWESYYERALVGFNDDYCGFESSYSVNLKSVGRVFHAQLEGYKANYGDITMEIAVSSLKSSEESTTNIEEIDTHKTATLTVAPNPAQKSIKISGVELNEESVIQIYSASGKEVKKIVGISDTNIDISDLENGIYHLNVINNNAPVSTKFIIEK